MKIRSEGRIVNGRIAWDQLLVFCRLKMMAEITERCRLNGRDIPSTYKSCMPEHVREVSKMDYAAARPVSAPLPSAAEISLRDETLDWIGTIDQVDRVVLWGYAANKSSRTIEAALKALGITLSYRAIQQRLPTLLGHLAGYWQARRYQVDEATAHRARMAIAQMERQEVRTPRAQGITYFRPERSAYDPVGDNRVVMVDIDRPQYKKRRVDKEASQTSQIRA